MNSDLIITNYTFSIISYWKWANLILSELFYAALTILENYD